MALTLMDEREIHGKVQRLPNYKSTDISKIREELSVFEELAEKRRKIGYTSPDWDTGDLMYSKS